MKYLKSINENIHDTKNWIENVMSTCKDIMLDIDDLVGTLEVVKEFYIEDREITINCTFNILYDWSNSREYWRKMHKDAELILADVEPRLIDYMKSEGFTYETYPLQTLNVGNSLNYKAEFKKPLDNEFVGHLRYLKKYKIFESVDIDTLKDILLDISDDNEFFIRYTPPIYKRNIFPLASRSIIIEKESHENFSWSSISDTILRLIDYLGDDISSIKLEFLKDKSTSLVYTKSNQKINSNIEIRNISTIDREMNGVDVISNVAITYKINSNYINIIPTLDVPIEEELGRYVDLDEEELISIDDILEPYKDYKPGYHPDNANVFGRSVLLHNGPVNANVYNTRCGCVWILKRGQILSNEISVSKFNSGYYILKSNIGYKQDRFTLYKDFDSVIINLKNMVNPNLPDRLF